MWSSGSTSSDLATGKKYLRKLLYVQHVNEEKDTASETPDRYLEEYLIADRTNFHDSKFTKYLKSPKANLSILKSSVKERIVVIEVYSNPLPIRLQLRDVTIHAFVVFQTSRISTQYSTSVHWWSLEKNGHHIVLQQSPNKDDVIKKIYDTETKTSVERLGPIKKQKSRVISNRMDIGYLLRIIWDNNQISEPYHIATSNCQHFASFVFEKLSDGKGKWSTMTSAIVNRIRLKKKKIQPGIEADADKYKSILKDDKFDYYWAMMEGRREDFEKLTNNLMIESLVNSVDSQGYTLLEWATVFSTSDWPIDEELKDKGAPIPSNEELFRRDVFFIALQYLPPNNKKSNFLSFDGIDINGVNKAGDTALHLALNGEKWGIAVKFLKKFEEYNVNRTNNREETALHLAAKFNCEFGLFKQILNRTNSENVNKGDGNGNTALHYAIEKKSNTKVEELLKHKDVNVNVKNTINHTPLHFASWWTDIPIPLFKIILEKTTDINANDKYGDTALHCAIIHNSEFTTKELLAHKDVDVNVKNKNNETALQLAANWKNIPVHFFKRILEKSTDVNSQNENGDTALHYAIFYKSETAVKELLNHKDVDVNKINKDDETALHYASQWWKDISIDLFKIFVEKSTDINAQDKNGRTALHCEIWNESKTKVKELLKHKDVNVNVKNKDHETALHLAFNWKDISANLFKIILEKSTDVNAQDKNGDTPLNLALKNELADSAMQLLRMETVDVNIKNNKNEIPLNIAVNWQNIPAQLLQLILRNTKTINALGNIIDTPMDRQLDQQEEKMIELHQTDGCQEKEQKTQQVENNVGKTIQGSVSNIVPYCSCSKEDGKAVNATNDNQETEIHLECLDVHKSLQFRKTSTEINDLEDEGNTPLMTALFNQSDTKTRELLPDSNVNIKNKAGWTALHYAAMWTDIPVDLFNEILSKSADINAQDNKGDTPLNWALIYESVTATLQLLRMENVNVNIKNSENEMAIHLAVRWQSIPVKIMKLIVQKTNDINASGNKGTALDLACKYKSTTAIEILQDIMKSKANPQKTITIDKSAILGMGSYSTVFIGNFNGEQVAVKRIPLYRVEPTERKVKIIKLLNHNNVIRFLGVDNDKDFRYYAFELAAGSLYHFCQGYYKGKMPSNGEALKQMAKGLQYIHGLKFVHRDIKPLNIVISKSEPVKLMITNFSLCKATTDSGTYLLGSGNKGTEEWMAPEICNCVDDDEDDYESVKKYSISSDTWALGCVFFYFLTKGMHPYGESLKKIRYNMLVKQRPSVEFEKTLQSSNKEMVEVCQLISDMIQVEPQERLSLDRVIKDLETIYPPDYNSNQLSSFNKARSEKSRELNEPKENDLPTGKGQENGQSSQHHIMDSDIGANSDTASKIGGNADDTTNNGGKTPNSNNGGEKNQDNTDKEKKGTPIECCSFCNDNIKRIKENLENVNTQAGKIGHVNESLIRTNLDSNGVGKIRKISCLFQLIRCYGEAKDHKWTDEDTNEGCAKVVKELIEKNTKKSYCSWYQKQASIWLRKQKQKDPKDIITLETSTNQEAVERIYDKYNRVHENLKYCSIPNSWENCEEFTKPNSPVFLLVLYESIRHNENLLSFPPPGILTMDVPVKILWGKSYPPNPSPNSQFSEGLIPTQQAFENPNVQQTENPEVGLMEAELERNQSSENHSANQAPERATITKDILTVLIEVGEIKSSKKGENDAETQLQRSLLCFKWLDQVINKLDTSYVLIGNIYISDNSSETQKIPESEKKIKTAFKGEGMTFHTSYMEYK